ncbi:MAG: DUF2716 domain-containing protein [Oscillospiraceae bacterium]|nr:DUF2716 domain-containing protein [Oscillospiraceae bacterium]
MRVINENEYNSIWDKINENYCFDPLSKNWLNLPLANKKYHLNTIWSDEQEKLVNSIFQSVNPTEMYALDWQHDCFVFAPQENIPLEHCYYDKARDCNVCFPSYYPNGDFYFFVSLDWSMGLFGHPWRNEIYVMGEKLITTFDSMKKELAITN